VRASRSSARKGKAPRLVPPVEQPFLHIAVLSAPLCASETTFVCDGRVLEGRVMSQQCVSLPCAPTGVGMG
jgi:hypothetical protein